MTEQEKQIKKLEDQLKWYQDKFDEINSSYYTENKLRKSARYWNYQYKVSGKKALLKKLLNPVKVMMFIKSFLLKKQ